MLNNENLEFEVSFQSWAILRKVNFAIKLIEKQEETTALEKMLKEQFEEIKKLTEELQNKVPDMEI